MENRDAFQNEIKAAVMELNDIGNTQFILSLGFTGRFDEELNDCLLSHAKLKTVPYFYSISDIQYESIKMKRNYLIHKLYKIKHKDIKRYEDHSDFLLKVFYALGENTKKLEAEYYHDWQANPDFEETSSMGGYSI